MSETSPPVTDDELTGLIARTASQDVAAFTRLYDLTCGAAYALAVRVTGHHHLAEEVLQEAYVHVWHHAGRFDVERGRPRTWVLMHVHRRAVDCVRAVRAASERDRSDGMRAVAATGGDIADDVHLRVEAAALRLHLADLTVEQQRVIALAYFGGYSQSEIAALTGDPLGTVKSRTRSALERLRAAMRPPTAPVPLPRAPLAQVPPTEAVA
ncbi:sigma-70 family RNA polymerase sigma factor [Microbacterium sp. EYE_5]|uniref:sigma-70 family RNA polymerase sigma factor n=1 Tax=unclassified Microbacterium TaxID=2609290 RepID=UPI002005E047|nr:MULTISPECIES: sigma-70 family RNA polymerase sigma factor [unclassified Microbacterium]MCK6079502.1 sigma-70 family RNA polymerase sigma factor [Microbacterium sp. EYE_382]MCK6084772.1 sigma-70 family RNA polymerase sigma factor [Microbacterium sp. EYE_384]MCK6123001.1 sigma-70 family RNA polymerase sigma factor [Microbacterium sp. EYE_80]MCK6125536.1 sigma-70 family RNA polymerase sigma factor [Microbacterium sp. EYE_79]MCK6140456.1 sigma-70 family RNA polymerase sigma factor [Microbacteri